MVKMVIPDRWPGAFTPSPVWIEGSPLPNAQAPLLKLPPEILHRVLVHAGREAPTDLANVATTCRALRAFVYENQDSALWRDVLLAHYDDPRKAGAFPTPRKNITWRERLQDRVFAENLLHKWEPDMGATSLSKHLGRLCATLLDLYLDLPGQDATLDIDGPASFFAKPATRNGPVLETALRSEAFGYMYLQLLTREASAPSLRPLPGMDHRPYRSARREVVNVDLPRLHVLLAPQLEVDVVAHREHRGYLRELVYGAHHYRRENDWAPLYANGKFNWTLVNAASTVMMLNALDAIAIGEAIWEPAVYPLRSGIETVRGLGFNHIERPLGLGPDEVWDWAGVTGRWVGSYAFLDYADWVQLNEPDIMAVRRAHLAPLNLTTYPEAVGDPMNLRIEVSTGPEAADLAYSELRRRGGVGGGRAERRAWMLPRLATPLPTSDLLPSLYFHGTSWRQTSAQAALEGASSFVRGVIRLTPDNPPEVRWTIMIRYNDEDRWRLEGVQVGGRGSRRGFFGVSEDLF